MKWVVDLGNIGDGTVDAAVWYAKALGIEGIHVGWDRVPGFAQKGYLEVEPLAALKKEIEDKGVEFAPMVTWSPRDLPTGEAAAEHFANRRRSFEAMDAIDCHTLVMFPPGRADTPWDEVVAYWTPLIEAAEENNIRVGIHNHGQFMPSAVLKRLMADVPSPSNGICLCSGNLWHGDHEEMYDSARELAEMGKVFFAHVRNVKTGEGEKEYWLEQGDVDLPRFIEALKAGGYDGWVRSEHLPTDRYRSYVPRVAGVSDIGVAYSVGYLRAYTHAD